MNKYSGNQINAKGAHNLERRRHAQGVKMAGPRSSGVSLPKPQVEHPKVVQEKKVKKVGLIGKAFNFFKNKV